MLSHDLHRRSRLRWRFVLGWISCFLPVSAIAEGGDSRIACLKMKASEIEMVIELENKNHDAQAIIAAYQEHQRRGRGLFREMTRLDQLNFEINELQLRANDLRREIDSLRSAGFCPD